MRKNHFSTCAVSAGLILGMLLTGCSQALPQGSESAASGISGTSTPEIDPGITVNSHNIEDVTGTEYGDQYSKRDIVNVTYNASDMNGLLPQKVGKELEYYFNASANKWDLKSEKTVLCEVDTSGLPGSSWKCGSLSSDDISSLYGDKVSDGSTGTMYIRLLKTMGLFAFNLDNGKNTSTERFFETTGTKARTVFSSASGNVEKSFTITGGSVTDAGDLFLDFEADGKSCRLHFGKDVLPISEREYDEATGKGVDKTKVYMGSLPVFEVSTTSIEKNEWKQICGFKEGNKSPALSWKPVEGASKYAVIMIDTTTNNWLSWYVLTDKTTLAEGEFTDKSIYIGPYPPETHTYELYVVALKSEPQKLSFKLDTNGGDIQSYLDKLNKASDGNVGNVLAYGTIKAPYTSPELYYGYR